MDIAKIIVAALGAVAAAAAIGLVLVIREFGKFADEIYPYGHDGHGKEETHHEH